MLDIFSRLKRQNSQSFMQAQMHFDKGVRLAAEGFYANAAVELKLATRANPGHAEAQLELGLAYHKTGQLSKAIKAYLSALEIDPSCVTAYKNLGAAYDEIGQFVDALKVYAKAIVLTPHDAELRIDMGLVYFNVGSYAEAIKAFKQALDIDSQNTRAHFCLGLVYLDLGDVQLALAEQRYLDGPDDKHLAFELLDKIQLQIRQTSEPEQAPVAEWPTESLNYLK